MKSFFSLGILLLSCLIYSTTLLAESVVIIQPMPKTVRVGEPFTFAAQYKGENITSFYCVGDWQTSPLFEKVKSETVNGYLYLTYKCIKRGNGTYYGGWSPVDSYCQNSYFSIEIVPDYTGLWMMTEKGENLLQEEYKPLETEKITVSAILNDGSGVYLQDVTSSATITWSCVPNVSDFNISSSGNFTVPTSIKQQTTVTINATYSDGYVTRSASREIVLLCSPVMVDVIFNANGGEGGISVTRESGSALVVPTVSREGYTFKGWSPSVPSVVPETTTTYTAQWQVNQYQMTFNANGGTGGQTLTLDYGSRLTAPSVSRTGYTFTGWNPSLPATVPAEAKTFVAQWRINQYTQTFDANGGEGGTVVTQDYNSQLSAPTVTRDGFAFLGWEPAVPSKVPAENVTYVAQWEIQAPSWETPDNYQNNMTIYAQVKDTTKDALIESAGSLLAAFDSNGQCRGVASITTGPTGKLYQLTVCSNTAAGEALTLKVWNASTGETIDIGESVAFVSDGKIGSLPAPKVYAVGQIALDVQLKTGWNWFSVNVELPRGTTLSEVFKDWTPCDEDVIKSATSTATYYDGVWYPEDFALEPSKMYQIKNSVTAPAMIRLMGAPVPSTTEIAVKAGWNWLGYTGTSAVDVATAFSADTVFTDEDLLKSGTASATYYGGQWWGDLKLEPGKGYKLQAANATTVKYASATPVTAPVALLSVGANPNWVADERQYNMTVYASVKDAAGRAFEAAGSWLGAFDANGICHGAVALGNGPRGKLYQLTPGSDTASGEVFTLKLWDAESGQIYDIVQTITFVSDGTVGSIINPQVYTVVETTVKFDVAANVIGDGIVTGAGTYEAGETVTLTATPAEGFVFCGWSTTPVSMEATHSFTMPEEAVTLTAYFAPVVALNNYIAGQGFVSADEVEAKIQEYIADNNLKTPEEVEAAIEAHVASNGLLTPAQANQQTQDYIVANKLKSEQEVAAAITQAIEEHVSSNGLLTPAEAEQLVNDYIADNKLMSKDEAKQELLDADEVFTADEMKEMAFDSPVIEVKDDVIEIAISLQTAESLEAWQAMALQGATLDIDAQKGQVHVKVPKGDKKAAFYKFVVPNEQ